MITGKFIGGKKIELCHQDSGAIFVTDAPKDNNGEGTSFSPTDMAASSLGACMVTIMAIVAEKNVIPFKAAHFLVNKVMGTNPRHIARIELAIHLEAELTAAQRNVLEKAAYDCPVHHSLSDKLKSEVTFLYDI